MKWNLWKSALIGSLALPLVAVADPADLQPAAPAADPNSANMPSPDTKKDMANPSADSAKEVTGTISSVSKHEVMLKADDGSKLTLQTDSTTQVFKPSGTMEKINQLKEGEQIRASYDMKADMPHALRIDVIPSSKDTTK